MHVLFVWVQLFKGSLSGSDVPLTTCLAGKNHQQLRPNHYLRQTVCLVRTVGSVDSRSLSDFFIEGLGPAGVFKMKHLDTLYSLGLMY